MQDRSRLPPPASHRNQARRRQLLGCFGWLLLALALAQPARADADLLLEEPINFLGDVTSTGHAVLYVSGLCSDDHTSVRSCHVGETGAVIGRYPGTPAMDWIAMSPQAYLYGVERPQDVPASITRAGYLALVDQYRDEHAQSFAGTLPDAVWVQLVGASYRRQITVVHLRTSAADDLRLARWLNAREGKSHFNFFFRNCADLVRSMLDVLYPGSVRRDMIFDAGFTTPKQLAVGLHRYERRHPELEFKLEVLPQIPGELPRSKHLYGVTESLAKTKWYFLPVALAAPYTVSTVFGLGLIDHRYNAQALAQKAPKLSPAEAAWQAMPAREVKPE